jgi:phytoene dehydrogenase-like protein
LIGRWTDRYRGGPACAPGTVHLGGTLEEIERSERQAWDGRAAEHPFVLLAQPTLFDPSRAPDGRHIAWTYCHVPHGSEADMLTRLEQQIERFAPGFRDRVLHARSCGRPTSSGTTRTWSAATSAPA